MNTIAEDQPIQAESMRSDRPSADHRIPEIFLIGSAKSATTSLANSLSRHPNISLGSIKEPNFFSHQASFAKGFDWYSSLYDDIGPDQLALDASTGYTRWPQNPGTAARIHACAPAARLIYLMRHPVDRAYSHFVHRWSKERFPDTPFTMSFSEYVKTDPMCLDSSNYQAQIEAYLEYFPRESLLCLFTDDVKQDHIGVLQTICRFAEIDDAAEHFAQPPSKDNQAHDYLEGRVRVMVTDRIKSIPIVKPLLPLVPKPLREGLYGLIRRTTLGASAEQVFTPPALTPEVRQEMVEKFAASNAWVEEFTGRDLSHWNE